MRYCAFTAAFPVLATGAKNFLQVLQRFFSASSALTALTHGSEEYFFDPESTPQDIK
jgi:hypothetical protein